MKKHNKKWITLMLAGLCSVSLGAAIVSTTAKADETSTGKTAATYEISEVFSTNGSASGETGTVAFTLGNSNYARIKRDLAFKWYVGKDDVKYFTMTFAFQDFNFKSVLFEIESDSSVATDDGKAVNAVKFTVEGEGDSKTVFASVINGKTEGDKIALPFMNAGEDVTLALCKGESSDSFGVTLNNDKIGEFTTIGANYADYENGKTFPLEISAVTEGDAKAVVLLKDINGQRFDNLTAKSETDSTPVVTDTAAPVLVVNESVSGFLLGTTFALEYEKVDVLQSSNYTDSKEYYQYNPTDTEKKYESLTTSVYFMDTTYTTEDGKVTSVYKENGKEYVSIEITLGDKTFAASEGEFAKKKYDLSWYATANATETIDGVDYIIIDRNEEGAKYTHITLDNENKVNVVSDTLAGEVETYQKRLVEAAEDVYAGSNSYIYFPSVKWLLNDNNGYRNLKFTISYRKPSSDATQTSSSLSYNGLKLSVADEGLYEFKIFAVDKAGNSMKYYLDGELVDVTTSNVWDIEEIPSFTFEIKNLGLKVDNETSTKASDRTDEEDIGEKYTLTDLKVVGASSLKENYALYIIDAEKADKIGLKESVLASITYQALRNKMSAGLKDVQDKKYIEYYLDCYSALLAEKLGDNVTVAQVKACFRLIEEFDDRITEDNDKKEWNKNNKYNWSVSSQSFTAADEGIYVIMADYWEAELPVQRAAAYKLIVVDSEVDSIAGATLSWIKNNVVSVVLFGIAGLMLIAIIVLLLIKPSDETMEDVDAKAEKAAKKSKKSDNE